MVARRKRCHLVPIDTIIVKEPAGLLIDLAGCEAVRPHVQEFLIHAPRATLCDFAQPAKDGELLVRHAHVDLVGLDVRLSNGLQFRGRCCGEEVFEDGKCESMLCEGYEALQVRFGDPTYWVYIRGRAVVFGHVAAETLIHVSAAEDKEATAIAAAADGGEKLCEEVCDDHAKAGLDVLEGETFGFAAAVDDETWGEVRNKGEEVC